MKNLRAVKGGDKPEKTAAVLTSKQTTDGEEFGRLGDAIARGHKPPCICPDKSKLVCILYGSAILSERSLEDRPENTILRA